MSMASLPMWLEGILNRKYIPSIFTPLHDTRMASKKGVTETRELTPLQSQLMMKCWKMNLRPGQASWWAPTAWRVGALGL